MNHQSDRGLGSVPTDRVAPRIAVIGAGAAGLSCARELLLRGYDSVVFEASNRLGGRCSSRNTRIGWFDDGAQAISGATRLATYVAQRPGELAAVHPWTVPATPAEDEPKGKDRDEDEDGADTPQTLKLMGAVGVPSMLALASAVAQPLDVRLHTPIEQAWRRGASWVLRDAAGEIDEDFQALVLAIPAPLALPLARESPGLASALHAVRYRSRWVLLLGFERPGGLSLPRYREFHGSPIERVAAMHSKPGRASNVPQRWFVEADERWSLQHEHDDAETVADLLLDNFCAHAGRSVIPNFLCAHHWAHAFVETPATLARTVGYLWDDEVRLGVCGDSVVVSRVDRAHLSGVALAERMAAGWMSHREHSAMQAINRDPRSAFEARAAHG
ncbi:MAG: FAD-dependent oxidoreductase [Caldimonas sp.]